MKICENQCWLVVCIPISGEFNPQGLQISLFVAVRSCQSFWLFKTLCIQMSEVEDGYLITLIFFWYVCVYTIHIYILYCIYYTIIYVYTYLYYIPSSIPCNGRARHSALQVKHGEKVGNPQCSIFVIDKSRQRMASVG